MGIVRRRMLMRTAAVGAVAYGAGRRGGRDAQAAEDAAASQPPPAPPAAEGGLGADTVEQLEQLAALRQQGILTEEEFAEQKARILNG